jgi:hypothetical protein
MHPAVCFVCESNKLECFLDALLDGRFRAAINEASDKSERLACRQVLVEAWILRQVADALADGGAIANDVLPENGGRARGWPGEAQQ